MPGFLGVAKIETEGFWGVVEKGLWDFLGMLKKVVIFLGR